MYAKIEPSGCGEFHGNVKVRFAFYLDPSDARYGEQHIQQPIIPSRGYGGAVDDWGSPVDQVDYDLWLNGLPREWQTNPFHNHYIYAEPEVTDDEITSLAALHLVNFYEAWRQGKPIRSGWDVAERQRPLRYEEVGDAAAYALRKVKCEQRAESIKQLPGVILPLDGGTIFPATAIDVGAGAIDRGGSVAPSAATWIDVNNAANETGILDTFELWFVTAATGVKVGTFYHSPSPNDFTNRDVEVLGNVSSGSKQTSSGLDCDVETGDWPGIFRDTGNMEQDTSGFDGVWVKVGDFFGGGSETYSENGTARALSIFATGETPAAAVPAPSNSLALMASGVI